MPKVYRKRPKKQFERKYWDGPNSTIEERKKVAWSDLSRSETTKAIAKRLTALTLASGLVVAVLPNGPVDLLGDGPSAAKRSP